MNENGNATLGNRVVDGVHEISGSSSEKILKFGTPILLSILVLIAFFHSLLSPGLLDEKFLLLWLKKMSHLPGESGFAAFLNWNGFERADSWGFVSKLFIFCAATILGKNIFLLKTLSIALHTANSLLVYRCGRVLTGARVPAIFAAVFFALYPLHFESVAWLGGMGSELGALFFLSALGVFIDASQDASQKGLNWKKLALVSVSIFFSLASSSMMWTACLAFTLYAICSLIFKKDGAQKNDISMSLIAVLAPIMVTGAYLAACGGLSDALWPGFAFKNILSCCRQIAFPINEINWHGYSKEYVILYIIYPFVLASFALNFFGCRDYRRNSIFTLLCTAALIAPALGIAGTSSNLYGERWLYAASAAWCLFLGITVAKLCDLRGALRFVGTGFAVLLLLAFSVVFLRHTMNENASALSSARVLRAAQKSMKIIQEKEQLPFLILANMPERMSVSPLFSPREPSLFDAQTGLIRTNALPDGRFKRALREGKFPAGNLRWDSELKSFLPLEFGPKKSGWGETMSMEELTSRMEPALGFYKNVKLSPDRKELLLESNTEHGPMITIATAELSALDGDFILVDAVIDAPSSFAAPRVELQWITTVHPDYEKRDRYSYADAIINDGKPHRYLLSLRRNGWTTGGSPRLIALGFPAGARVRLLNIGVTSNAKIAELKPVLDGAADPNVDRFTVPYYKYPLDSELGFLALSENAANISAEYSVAHIEGATGVAVELSQADKNFDDANSQHMSGHTFKTFRQKGSTGRIQIPVAELPAAGVYSIRVIASAASGSYLGQFSDPLCYQVPLKRKN